MEKSNLRQKLIENFTKRKLSYGPIVYPNKEKIVKINNLIKNLKKPSHMNK